MKLACILCGLVFGNIDTGDAAFHRDSELYIAVAKSKFATLT